MEDFQSNNICMLQHDGNKIGLGGNLYAYRVE